jgi:hypothetical protein
MFVRSDPDVIQRLVADLSPDGLRSVIRSLTANEIGPWNDIEIDGKFVTVKQLLNVRRLESAGIDAMRSFLLWRLQSNFEDRKKVYLTNFDLRDLGRATDRELERATALLKANHDSMYQEYDRLNSEADFRIEVACPSAS